MDVVVTVAVVVVVVFGLSHAVFVVVVHSVFLLFL